jgi:Tfp pilus assembly protein PilF
MFEAVERLDKGRDFATEIAYNYSKCGDYDRTRRWSAKAHERSPTSVTAYNTALDHRREGDLRNYEKVMEESLRLNPDNDAALHAYGHYLMDRGDPRGTEYVERACDLFYAELRAKTLSEDDCGRLQHAASTLGKRKILEELRAYRAEMGATDEVIREEYLAAGAEANALRTVG